MRKTQSKCTLSLSLSLFFLQNSIYFLPVQVNVMLSLFLSSSTLSLFLPFSPFISLPN